MASRLSFVPRQLHVSVVMFGEGRLRAYNQKMYPVLLYFRTRKTGSNRVVIKPTVASNPVQTSFSGTEVQKYESTFFDYTLSVE